MGFVFAISAAIIFAIVHTFSKSIVQQSGSPFVSVAVIHTLAVPLWFLCFWWYGWPELTPQQYLLAATSFLLIAAGEVAFHKSVQLGSLSTAVPMITLTPLFVILPGYVLLQETLSLQGIIGVALVSMSGYLLYGDKLRQGFKTKNVELKALGMAFLAAIIFAITTVIDKTIIKEVDAIWYAIQQRFFTLLILIPLAYTLHKPIIPFHTYIQRHWVKSLIGAVLLMTTMLLAMSALQLISSAYYSAIVRAGMLAGAVITSTLVFKEPFSIRKAITTLAFGTGVILLLLS